MATRKGINISGNYAAPHNITCLVHICTLYLKKMKGRTKSHFTFFLQLLRPSDPVFSFRVKSNSSQRLYVRIDFFKFKYKTKPF